MQPTEDKYSMVPLMIKGFLPQQNGSAIMLPAEITSLSGSDFDVDKLYVMLPEFTVQKYDKRRARLDYAKQNAQFNEIISQFTNSKLAEDILNEDPESFKEWFERNKKNYKLDTPIIRKVKYDYTKTPTENSVAARNNLFIDMITGVLTNSDTASKILNPGGFDYQKKAARISTILNDVYEEDLKKALQDLGVQFNKTIVRNGRNVEAPISSYLFDLSLKQLDKLADRTKRKLNPLSPRTQVILHQQNMNGGKLIGIYANHNANHALMQHTELSLDTENGSFVLNGKRFTSLHNITNDNKEFISRNNAGYLAASVDNVKDPVLAALNQNTFTADASMLLSRLGYNPIEVGLLMNQPIIQEITQKYFQESREGKGKDTIIDEVLSRYKNKASITNDLTYDNHKNEQFYVEDLADNILLGKEVEAMQDTRNTPDFRKVQYYQKQVAVGYLFKRIMSSADALGQLVQATREDTQGGAAGPTIADTMIKIQKVQDLLSNITNLKYPLREYALINDSDYNGTIDEIRDKLLESKLPFLQAFYTLGLKKTEKMLAPYFPQYSEGFNSVIETLRGMTKRGKLDVKTMNNIYNDLFAYSMSSTGFFGSEMDSNENIVSANQKRKDFINNFPPYFKKIVSENPDIADLEFIKRLKIVRANQNNPVDVLVFKNVGQLSSTLRERYMRDWASLLYMQNPKAQSLALNLFRYSYFRNGFAFGPNTFIHLAPTAVRLSIPEYIEGLQDMIMSDAADYGNFIDQYIYNHLDNRKLVPEIADESTVKFTDNEGNIVDNVTITITKDSSYADKKFVRETTNTDAGPEYSFFDYIAKRIKGNYVYYRLNNSSIDQNTATYYRIEPLGFKNSFIEYEYGKSVEEMESVIDKNKKDYNPNAGIEAQFERNNNPDVDYDSVPNYSDAYNEDAMAQAFSRVYGIPLDNTNNNTENDMTSIPPNNDYTDVNGDKACGAPVIYTL